MLGFRVPSAGISIMHLLTAMPDILSATLARVFDNCIIVTLKIGKLINLNLNLITNIDLASIALQETSEETTLLRLGTQNRRVALKGIDTKGLVVVGCCASSRDEVSGSACDSYWVMEHVTLNLGSA